MTKVVLLISSLHATDTFEKSFMTVRGTEVQILLMIIKYGDRRRPLARSLLSVLLRQNCKYVLARQELWLGLSIASI